LRNVSKNKIFECSHNLKWYIIRISFERLLRNIQKNLLLNRVKLTVIENILYGFNAGLTAIWNIMTLNGIKCLTMTDEHFIRISFKVTNVVIYSVGRYQLLVKDHEIKTSLIVVNLERWQCWCLHFSRRCFSYRLIDIILTFQYLILSDHSMVSMSSIMII
jgi:hypothetical protein